MTVIEHQKRPSRAFRQQGLWTVLFASLLMFTALSVQAQNYPARPTGPVADLARVIDAQSRQQITVLAQALWEQANFALVVATVPSIGQQSVDEYAPALYKHWGIGKKGKDEGVLVLLSLDPREIRIEIGFGSEGYLNDAKVGRMLDQYGLPHFRQGEFSAGLINISKAIASEVAKEKAITLSAPHQAVAPAPAPDPSLSLFELIFIILILAVLVGTPFGRTLLTAMLLSSLFRGGRGGGRGSGGFGGGFGGGGFGGGSSGGGGASRRF